MTWLFVLLVLFGVGCAAFGIGWHRAKSQNQSVLKSLRSHRNMENPVYGIPARTGNGAAGIIDASRGAPVTHGLAQLNPTYVVPIESGGYHLYGVAGPGSDANRSHKTNSMYMGYGDDEGSGYLQVSNPDAGNGVAGIIDASSCVPVTHGLAQLNPTYIVPIESGGYHLYEAAGPGSDANRSHKTNSMYMGYGDDEGSGYLQVSNPDAEA